MKSQSSVVGSLPMELQSHARLCEEELGGIMLGTRKPIAFWRKSKVRGYFIDLFSGTGGVSRAIHSLGFEAKQRDILHGPLRDLTDTSVVNRIQREIKRNRVKGVMMAPVCTSFSRARDRTKVIRTHRYP